MADTPKDSSAAPSPSVTSPASGAPPVPAVAAGSTAQAPVLTSSVVTPAHPSAEEALAKVVLGTDTEKGYQNAAAASKGVSTTSVAVFLKQKGHEPHQVPGFIKKMEEKFSGAVKTAAEWTHELESFLQRKIH